jgi:competence protein ComEA
MKRIVMGVLAALLTVTAAAAQDNAKGLVERACTKCHSLASTLKQRNSRAGWSAIVDDMVARGAELSDAEIETVIGYLSTLYGPKVNVNKAGAQELARVLEIPEPSAEAIVEYRAKHGSFKNVGDLKKVREVEKIIDSKKELLDFGDSP